jgi:hypothetical protein
VEASIGEREHRFIEAQLDSIRQLACEGAVRDGGGGGDALVVGVGDADLDRGSRSQVDEDALDTAPRRRPMLPPMKKLLVLIVVVALAAFAVKKLQDA